MAPPTKSLIFRITLTICFLTIGLPGYNSQMDERILFSKPVTKVKVENFTFRPSVKLPGSNETLFLGGAGIRGLELQGKFVKFTAIGVYLEEKAVPWLADKWRCSTVARLEKSIEFFKDIVTGPFEKFIRVSFVRHLTGQQYSEKVAHNCVKIWKSAGVYAPAQTKALETFLNVFKTQDFLPGSSIYWSLSTSGSLIFRFSKDVSIPKVESAVIKNRLLGEAFLESIIGQNGVSPATKKSLATRLPEIMKKYGRGN
ncbi:hypothetical protein SLEP1_g32781 [Rubroshorea leprosula]|uniref:Chalcone-flavonone isomerase family protein n=1 Tax=Rubroshorea leprosula TaxID=152421 RepID=A0AAV5KEG6_9ROSI|nr:hypothetical protein SLEP1_g32781 [Rubroshorea leprosula]